MTAKYYRGPDEPGGSGDIMLEVVDGISRRMIERSGLSVQCRGYDEYPGEIDMDAVSDYVWEIDKAEFEAAWQLHCARPGTGD
jgi:hypothetical protein